VIYFIFVADLIFRFALVIKTLNKLGGCIQFAKSNWLSILAVFADPSAKDESSKVRPVVKRIEWMWRVVSFWQRREGME